MGDFQAIQVVRDMVKMKSDESSWKALEISS